MNSLTRRLFFVLFGLLLSVGQGFGADRLNSDNKWESVDIGSCKDLVAFADAVNSKGKYKDKNLVIDSLGYFAVKTNVNIVSPIDMSCSSNFPMIGHESYASPQNFAIRYAGTFDGQGFAISNLKITKDGVQNVGLIAVLATGGVVRNVVLDNIDYNASGERSLTTKNPISIGGIVGWQADGSVVQCYVSGSISTSGRQQRVGGITGYADGGSISECLSFAKLYTSSNASSIGGIVGATGELTNIVSVTNNVYGGESILNDGDGYTGGITGVNYGDSTKVDNCFYDSSLVDRTVGNGDANSKNSGGVGVGDVNVSEVVSELNKGCNKDSGCVWSNGQDDITNMGVSNDRADETVYTIEFVAGDSCVFPENGTSYKQLKFGVAITADNISQPTCADKKFLGWSKKKDGTDIGNLGTVEKSSQIYAVWKDYVTLTFDANGGAFKDGSATKEKKIAEGGKVSSEGVDNPVDYVKGSEYYVFMGWALSKEATAPAELGTSSENTKIYAVWKATSDIYYTVKFDGNGHDVNLSDVRVKKGDAVADPGVIVAPEGYEFVNWFTNVTGKGDSYNFTSGVAKDLVLYAKWKLKSYSVSYELDGGVNSAANPSTFTIESETIVLQDPAKDGYKFLGWYTDGSYTEAVSKIITGTSKNVSLEARWKKLTYTVRYAEGTEATGESIASKTVDYGSSVKLEKCGIYKMSEYTQQGWALTDGGDKKYDCDKEYILNQSMVLYPAWKKIIGTTEKYSITYVISGVDGANVSDFIDGKYIGVNSLANVRHKVPSLINDKYVVTDISCKQDDSTSLSHPYFRVSTSDVKVFLTVAVKQEIAIVKYGPEDKDTIVVLLPATNSSTENSNAIKDALDERGISVPEKTSDLENTYKYNGNWEKQGDVYIPVYDPTSRTQQEITVVVGGENVKVEVPEDASPEEINQAINEAGKDDSRFPSVGDEDASGHGFGGEWKENKDGNYEPVYDKVPEGSSEIKVAVGKDSIAVVVKDGDVDNKINDKINDAVADASTKDPTLDVPSKGDKDAAGFEFNGNWEDKDGDGVYEPSYDKVPEGSSAVEVVVGKDNSGKDVVVEVVVKDDDISASGELNDNANSTINTALTEIAKNDPSIVLPIKNEAGFEHNGSWKKDESSDKYDAVCDKVPEGSTVVEVVVGKDNSGKDVVVEVVVKKDDISESGELNDKANATVNKALEEIAKNDPSIVLPIKNEAGFEHNGSWKKDESTDKYDAVCDKVPEGSTVVEVVVGKDNSGKDVVVEVVVKKDDISESGELNDNANSTINTALTEIAKNDPTIVLPIKNEAGFEHNGSWKKDESTDKYDAVCDKVPEGGTVVEVVVGKDNSGKDVVVEVVVKKDDISESGELNDNANATVNKALEEIAKKDSSIVPPATGDKNSAGFEFSGNWEDKDNDGLLEPSYDKVPEGGTVVEVVVGKDDSGKDEVVEVVVKDDDSADKVNEKINNALADVAAKDSSIAVPVVGEVSDEETAFNGTWVKNEDGEYVPVYVKAYRITYVMPKSAKLSKDVKAYARGMVTALPSAYIENDSSWKFMGWFEDERMFGTRVRSIGAEAKGRKTFYALFQKAVKYKAGNVSGEMTIAYSDDAESEEQTIETALKGVVPAGYDYSTWKLEDGIYTLGMTKVPLASSFKVSVAGRIVNIAGAKIGSKVVVSDGLGRTVLQGRIDLADQRVELPSAGNYIVRVGDMTRRIMVR